VTGDTFSIIVCVKQVPASETVETDEGTGTLKRTGVASQLNPFDLYALEEAVRIRGRLAATGCSAEVTALSMGPPQAEHALRYALALGCDRAVLLSDRAFAGADTLATSYTLARGVAACGRFDLILCGTKTTDGDTGQVGPGLAELLAIPHVCYVTSVSGPDEGALTVERELDLRVETLVVDLPCLVTVVKGINEPRMPDLEQWMAARERSFKVLTAKDLDVDIRRLGLAGSPTRVVRVFPPPKRARGRVFDGDPEDAVSGLVQVLLEQRIVGDGGL
jgi:electron transfer flavoprotein beta subunit